MAGMLLQQAAPVAGDSYVADLLRSGLAVVFVALLALVTLRYVQRRGFGRARGAGSAVEVLARVPLEPRKSLYVVRAAGRVLLIGTGEGGAPALIAELPSGSEGQGADAGPAPESDSAAGAGSESGAAPEGRSTDPSKAGS
jgi:flagellar protein FliO/FliZ